MYILLAYVPSLEQNDIAGWIYTYTLLNCKINKLDFLGFQKKIFLLSTWLV